MKKKTIKKVIKKPKNAVAKNAPKPGKPVGRVVHYFDNIKVAIIKLSLPLSEGDQIRIMGGEATDFNQKVGSMQVDHKEVKKAKKGASIGLKVKEKARDGYMVYKV